MRSVSLIVVAVALLALRAPRTFAEEDLTTPRQENSDGEPDSLSDHTEASETDSNTTEISESPLDQARLSTFRTVAAPFMIEGPPPNRLAISLGGGWPALFLDIVFAANDVLATEFQLGYFYGAPHAGLRSASGIQGNLGTRLRILRRSLFELSFGVTAGLIIGLDRHAALVSEDVITSDVTPLGIMLDLDLTLTWRFRPNLAFKFGLSLPTLLLLDMAERPDEDAWELAIPFAARVGATYRLLDWLSVYILVDIGPALTVIPSTWASNRYEQETDAAVYLRGSAGLTLFL